jgi:uncharacterized protein YlxP (DUF503 family)
MKIKYIILILMAFLCMPKIANALDPACTTKEQNRLKELVNRTQVSYEIYDAVDEDTGDITKAFRVSISNFSSDFFVEDTELGTYFEYIDNPTVVSDGFFPNQTLQLPFYASYSGVCHGFLIMTKMVAIPPYNEYSEDPLCEGIENYELCKPYTSISIDSYSQFEDMVKAYKASLNNNNDDKPTPTKEEKESIWNQIFDFLIKYNLYFLLPMIILGTTGIVIIEIRKRRSIL